MSDCNCGRLEAPLSQSLFFRRVSDKRLEPDHLYFVTDGDNVYLYYALTKNTYSTVNRYSNAEAQALSFDVKYGILGGGQSLREGGVGGDVISGVDTAEYPLDAFMLTGGPIGLNTATLTGPITGVKEPTRVTTFSSMAKQYFNAVGRGVQLVFAGQAWGGKNYSELQQGGASGVFEAQIAQVQLYEDIVPGISWRVLDIIHGEQDGIDNNTSYDSDLVEWLSDTNTAVKSITDQSNDMVMLLCQTSTSSGYANVGGITELTFPTPLLQLSAHETNADIIMMGPKYFLEYDDHSHVTNLSQRIWGEYRGRVLDSLFAGNIVEPLRPDVFEIEDSSILATFVGNDGQLQFKTTAFVKQATNEGFAYIDDSARTITSVEIVGVNQVRVNLSGTVGTNAVLAYAHHNGDSPGGAAVQVDGRGARGNLCDSSTDVSLYDDTYQLLNWCVHFRKELN